MDQKKVLRIVSKLLEAKEKVQENIDCIEKGGINGIRSLMGSTKKYQYDYDFFGARDQWINGERFYDKVKYLILAEMKETLDEINAEIDKLVTFKDEES